VVREGTEGPYVGNGGALRVGSPAEIATEVSINTRYGVERVVRDAFARAQSRERQHLTLVHKHNVLVNAVTCGAGRWTRWVRSFPGDHGLPARGLGDDLHGHRPRPLRRDRHRQPLRRHPDRHRGRGHGGIGWLPAATSTRKGPPQHVRAGARLGSDIAGQGIADPTAAILSVAMLLDHLGRPKDAFRVEQAVASDLSTRGTAARSTAQVGDAIASLAAG